MDGGLPDAGIEDGGLDAGLDAELDAPLERDSGPLPSGPLGRGIANGLAHTCARDATGGVACWGGNRRGQLGDGTTGSTPVPVRVPGLTGVFAVAAGAGDPSDSGGGHTCALREDGSVLCWGSNAQGQVGDGTTEDRSLPTPVSGISDAVEISGLGAHTCARHATGTVSCWGYNGYGALGDATTVSPTTPVAVVGLGDAVGLATGFSHSCALRAGGTVVCWGINNYGQLGDASASARTAPVAVVGITDAVEIAAGTHTTCARHASGSVSCWGYGGYGALGDGLASHPAEHCALECVEVPVSVIGVADAVQLALGQYFGCALRSGGAIACWGDGRSGALGNGAFGVTAGVPVAVVGVTDATEIAAGWSVVCAYRGSDRELVCWGDNTVGTIGDGTTIDRSTPTVVTLP